MVELQSKREHRALILAKEVEMLQGQDFAWSGLLDGVAKRIPKSEAGEGFVFVSTAGQSASGGGPDPLPEEGVVSMGNMPQWKWWYEVAKGKVMVGRIEARLAWRQIIDGQLGVGRPWLSPSRKSYASAHAVIPLISSI